MIRRDFVRRMAMNAAGLLVADDALGLLLEPRKKLWTGADFGLSNSTQVGMWATTPGIIGADVVVTERWLRNDVVAKLYPQIPEGDARRLWRPSSEPLPEWVPKSAVREITHVFAPTKPAAPIPTVDSLDALTARRLARAQLKADMGAGRYGYAERVQ